MKKIILVTLLLLSTLTFAKREEAFGFKKTSKGNSTFILNKQDYGIIIFNTKNVRDKEEKLFDSLLENGFKIVEINNDFYFKTFYNKEKKQSAILLPQRGKVTVINYRNQDMYDNILNYMEYNEYDLVDIIAIAKLKLFAEEFDL